MRLYALGYTLPFMSKQRNNSSDSSDTIKIWEKEIYRNKSVLTSSEINAW